MRHQTLSELESRLDEVRVSPKDCGTLELIAFRPGPAERETPEKAQLDTVQGVVGDRWYDERGRSDGPDRQLTVMNSRAAALFAGARSRWALCGDQLYVDLDLSYDNLPPGTCLAVGETMIEVTPAPHLGCGKFIRRFGVDAARLTKSPPGREINVRGINARVLTAGTIRRGDPVSKLS